MRIYSDGSLNAATNLKIHNASYHIMPRQKLVVQRAYLPEVFKDLVRIPEEYRPVQNSTICRLKAVGGGTALVSIRGIPLRDGEDCEKRQIKIDEVLRQKLGVDLGEDREFIITRASIFGRIWWHCTASDPAVRIPAQLGAISMFLGIISVVLAFYSLYLATSVEPLTRQ